jgi:uncharacterized repeat protein (TIGR03803 family)
VGGKQIIQKGTATALAALERKSRVVSVILAFLALLLVLLAIYPSAARAQTWSEVVLHSFDGKDGLQPMAGVIQDGDGNLYGTTELGGANGFGTVFRLTSSGKLTTLHSFCSEGGSACTDGVFPLAGVIQGSDGNFYGTTSEAGANGVGTVFKITPSGTLTTLYSFCSQADCTDGESPAAGLIQGSDGYFYSTTYAGGANENESDDYSGGTVFKIAPSGTLTTLYSFCSMLVPGTDVCLDGSEPEAGLTQGSDGNFYGTTYAGGANGFGTVFELTPSGTLTTLYSFCSEGGDACAEGAFPSSGVIQGSDGNFYGTTGHGGANDRGNWADGVGTVFKLMPSGTLTSLYSFCSQADCIDGQYPYGVIQGSDGNLYGTTLSGGANTYGGTVFELTPSGMLTTLYSFCATFPIRNFCLDGGGSQAALIQGSDGSLYGTTTTGGARSIRKSRTYYQDGTVFELSPPPGYIKVVPTKLTLKAESNAQASAIITIENTGTGQVTVDISQPKHDPPFSELGGGNSIAIGAGGSYQITIAYSPTNSTTSKEKSDSIMVTAISNDPTQEKPITVKLKGAK